MFNFEIASLHRFFPCKQPTMNEITATSPSILTLVLLCPDIYGVKDVLDQYKYHLILIKQFLVDA